MSKYNYSEFTTQIHKDSINVLICSASFEERSTIIPILLKNSFESNLIFYNSNEVKTIAETAKKIELAFEKKKLLVELNSDKPVENYWKINSEIESIATKVQKPNILIDITTFTHETLLALLKILNFKKDVLGKVQIAYTGAKEYSFNLEKDEDKWLSKGIKEIRTVLGYSGITDPTLPNHLIILFGFEIERTKKIIEEYEFDFISLGFGDAPIQDNHLKINYERHSKLLQDYPNAQKFTFSLTCPEKAKEQILEYINSNDSGKRNTVIAPLNNKISTVGAGLAALENENMQIAYAKPMIYNYEGYSHPNDDIYLFELKL